MTSSRAKKRLWHAAWLTVVVVGVVACEREEEMQLEIVELAKGQYSGMNWGGTQVERFHVVARKGTRNRPEDEVVLVSPQHDEPCSLGPLALYSAQQPRSGAKFVLGSPSPVRVALFDDVDEHGIGRLSFADIECERTDLEVMDVGVRDPYRLYLPDLTSVLYGLFDPAWRLILVDPWDERVMATEAIDVQRVIPVNGGAWLIEAGQLVKRDLDGRELERKGKAIHPDDVRLGSEDDLAYIDEGRVIVERLGKTREVAKDACRLQSLDGFIPGALSFYAPCEENRLTVHRTGAEPLRYKAPIEAYTAQRGQLITMRFEGDRTVLETAFAHDPLTLRPWVELPPVARLANIWPAVGSWLVQVEMADETVTLYRVEDRVPATSFEVVAEGLTRVTSDTRGLAWIKEGELTVTDRNASGVYLRARNVSSYRWVFERNATAIAYTERRTSETGLGHLRLHFLTGERYSLASDVREYQHVWWPERGILFVQDGDEPGMRFARVDLPCEMTSDSPWACGF